MWTLVLCFIESMVIALILLDKIRVRFFALYRVLVCTAFHKGEYWRITMLLFFTSEVEDW